MRVLARPAAVALKPGCQLDLLPIFGNDPDDETMLAIGEVVERNQSLKATVVGLGVTFPTDGDIMPGQVVRDFSPGNPVDQRFDAPDSGARQRPAGHGHHLAGKDFAGAGGGFDGTDDGVQFRLGRGRAGFRGNDQRPCLAEPGGALLRFLGAEFGFLDANVQNNVVAEQNRRLPRPVGENTVSRSFRVTGGDPPQVGGDRKLERVTRWVGD